MAHTFPELMEFLKQMDEVTLLELLQINSEDILAAFSDKVWLLQDRLKMNME